MRHFFVGLAMSTIIAAWPGAANAEVVLYLHPHPVAPSVGDGMCHIEGPHVHSYAPHAKVLYTKVHKRNVFVGDPVEFDKKHEKHAYYGHHPLFWIDNGDGSVTTDQYCFITGPHYHWYAPPSDLKFTLKGDAYWYVGAHPGWYARRWKPRHRRLARHYGRVTVHHPTVTIEPPSGFVGLYVGTDGFRPYGVVGVGGIRVRGPGGSIRAGVGLDIRVPGVGVVFGRRGKRHVRRRHIGRRGPPRHAPAWGYRGKHKRKHKFKRQGHGPKRGYGGKRGGGHGKKRRKHR